jgi:hypothetical protein
MAITQCSRCGKNVRCPPSRIASSKHIFCSRECNFPPVSAACAHCGRTVKCTPSRIANATKIYCSPECRRLPTALCERCGKTFRLTIEGQRYCSLDCRSPAQCITCARCGRSVRKSPSRISRGIMAYCSKECYQPPRRFQCRRCGKTVTGSPNKAYCSEDCYRAAKSDAGRISIVCLFCGKLASQVRSKARRALRLYCSPECHVKHQRKEVEQYAIASGWPGDIRLGDAIILNYLGWVGVPLRHKEIAAGVGTTNISKCLARLVERGLLLRFLPSSQKRTSHAFLYTLSQFALEINEHGKTQSSGDPDLGGRPPSL